MSGLPVSSWGRYAVVVAHPDDEVLWFSSVLAGASKIILCYGEAPGDGARGANRRRAIAKFPLATVQFLDLPEGGFLNLSDWNRPAVSDHGPVLRDETDQARYARNFSTLLSVLTPLLSDVDCVFTHGPWGEYGHEDHAQLFHAVDHILRQTPGRKLLVPAIAAPKSALLKSRYVNANPPELIQMPADQRLADTLKALYVAHQCWTWAQDWKVPETDRFYVTTPSAANFNYTPPRAADLMVVGGMATIPTRLPDLPRVVRSVLPHLDHLYLWFDLYDEVPEGFRHMDKVTPVLAKQVNRRLGCSGKFRGLREVSQPCLYFCFDDDIIYPPGYVHNLRSAISRYDGRMVVGVHAKVFDMFPKSYVRDRKCLHFEHALPFDCLVDELGTGTIAFRSDAVPVAFETWPRPNMSDLNLMLDCVRRGIGRVSVRRPKQWLKPIARSQDDSIWKVTQNDDQFQTERLNETMRAYPERWATSASAAASGGTAFW